MVKHISQYDPSREFEPWLTRICVNTYRSTLRRLAQNFYVVRRSLVPFCVVARRIRRKVGVDEHTKQIMDLYAMGVPIIDTRRIFAPSLWKLFNSYSRKELPQKDWPVW